MFRKISVIVPAYNQEKHLRRCLDSLLGQTIDDWEVIIVNDGSLDETGKIADAFAATDDRIRVIHTDNHGVSHARNTGLNVAVGEYVVFVDSDDFVAPSYLESLYNSVVSENKGVAFCDYVSIKEQEATYYRFPDASRTEYETLDLNNYDYAYDYRLRHVWGVVFRRTLLQGLYFHEELSMGEDALFVATAISRATCTQFNIVKQPLYGYVDYSVSLSHGCVTPKRFTVVEAWKHIISLYDGIEMKSLVPGCFVAMINECIDLAMKIDNKAVLRQFKKVMLKNLRFVVCSCCPLRKKIMYCMMLLSVWLFQRGMKRIMNR